METKTRIRKSTAGYRISKIEKEAFFKKVFLFDIRYTIFVLIFPNFAPVAADELPVASTATNASIKEISDYALSYQEAAEAGDRVAQYNLGAAYRWGVGVPQNTEFAVK